MRTDARVHAPWSSSSMQQAQAYGPLAAQRCLDPQCLLDKRDPEIVSKVSRPRAGLTWRIREMFKNLIEQDRYGATVRRAVSAKKVAP